MQDRQPRGGEKLLERNNVLEGPSTPTSRFFLGLLRSSSVRVHAYGAHVRRVLACGSVVCLPYFFVLMFWILVENMKMIKKWVIVIIMHKRRTNRRSFLLLKIMMTIITNDAKRFSTQSVDTVGVESYFLFIALLFGAALEHAERIHIW